MRREKTISKVNHGTCEKIVPQTEKESSYNNPTNHSDEEALEEELNVQLTVT